ncbi:MAG: HAMP domain-containing protein [Rhodospirillales bacterium]|nr:HAMP domain-containing protein [Rhodospirillales bacterium]
MSERRPLDSDLIGGRARGYAERSFMGGTRIGSRAGLLVFVGLVLIGGLGGVLYRVDGLADHALGETAQAQRLAQLAETARREVLQLRVHEKDFLLRKDPAASETLVAASEQAARTLDALYNLPAAKPLQSHVATVRDGLLQYGSHFAEAVKIETLIGLSADKGLRGDVAKTASALEAKFRELNLAAAMTQIARVNRIVRESLLPETKVDHALIEKNYETLRLLVAAAQLTPRDKAALEASIKTHETDAGALINARLKIDRETRAFDEVFAYMGPSLEEIVLAAERATALAAENVARTRAFARIAVAGGAGGILVFLVLFAALLLRSVYAPVRRVAAAAARLADGERDVPIPVRGNVDAVGQVARALDRWAATLDELDRVRAELDDAKRALAEAHAAAPAALPEPEPEPETVPEPMPIPSPAPAAETAAQPPAPSPEPEPPAEPGEEVAGLGHPKGRFASLGQKLAHFSRAVSNATRDVERTEDLVRGIADATEKVVEMGSLVAAIRDQANLIAFKAGVREARGAEDNLVLFSPDVKLPPDSAEAQSSARFDQMRDMVDRAERTVQAAHAALVGVTGIAQEVAAGASNQALEATQQLLAQSEYLHHMLDDVLARVRPHAQPAKGEKPKPESGRDKA